MFTQLVVALSAGALVAAQSLSQSCQNALEAVAGNQDAATCTAIGDLSNIFLVGNGSIVPPISSFVSDFCRAAPCSSDTIASVVNNITTGCSADLATLGISSANTQAIVSEIQQLFPIIKNIVCIEDISASEFCIPEFLNALQSALGTLTLTTVVNDVTTIVTSPASIPQSVLCSKCVAATLDAVDTNLDGLVNSSDYGGLTNICGADFLSSTPPAGVTVATGAAAPTASGSTTGGSSTSKPNGAQLTAPPVTFAASGLLAVFATFIFFA